MSSYRSPKRSQRGSVLGRPREASTYKGRGGWWRPSGAHSLDQTILSWKATLTFQVLVAPRPCSWNTGCEYFVLRATIFPNTRKYEHIMMSVFMSWGSLSKIINVKAFTYSGTTHANAEGLVQAKGTGQRGRTEKTAWQSAELRVICSTYRLLRRAQANVSWAPTMY